MGSVHLACNMCIFFVVVAEMLNISNLLDLFVYPEDEQDIETQLQNL